MRRPIIAGNWKMNKLGAEAAELAKGIVEQVAPIKGVDVVLGPTFVSISQVAQATAGSDVKIAAQNMHTATSGAFTGEISPTMLKDVGCDFVILGHSERRQFFGETDEGVNRKAKVALAHGLTPIICIGETLKEREAGNTIDKVNFQVRAALAGLTEEQAGQIVLAYEPIWAIGTGVTATPEQAQEVHAALRDVLADLYSDELAQKVRIQYGGSVKPANIESLISQPDIDGALVGGASLKVDSFVSIILASNS